MESMESREMIPPCPPFCPRMPIPPLNIDKIDISVSSRPDGQSHWDTTLPETRQGEWDTDEFRRSIAWGNFTHLWAKVKEGTVPEGETRLTLINGIQVTIEQRYVDVPLQPFDDMGLLYAYQQGYHGQGVTVVNSEPVDINHPELSVNIVAEPLPFKYTKEDLEAYYEMGDMRGMPTFGHGTAGAAAIGAPRNGQHGHGIAPQAKIVPLPQPLNNTDELPYILEKKFPIVNNSLLINDINRFAGYSIIVTSDVVFVWSAGNFPATLSLASKSSNTVPAYFPGTEDNWLVVGNLDRERFIEDNEGVGHPYYDPDITGIAKARYARCGEVRRWCVLAPIHSSAPNSLNPTTQALFNATSGSAAVASGALAVLKSAAPAMPITVVRAIMLATATDYGEPGIDGVSGWGVINVSAAIAHIENLKTAGTNGQQGASIRAFASELPDGFRYLRRRMDGQHVAVKITDNSYYNMPLKNMFVAGEDSSNKMGNTALDMLSDNIENTPPGFGAFGDSQSTAGLRWHGNYAETSFMAEYSHAFEHGVMDDVQLGALGSINAKNNNGKVHVKRNVYGILSAFGEYQYGHVKGRGNNGILPLSLDNTTTRAWKAGLALNDLIKNNDQLQIFAHQDTHINNGQMTIETPVAIGDFYDSFLGESEQNIETRRVNIPLKQKTDLIWSLGYVSYDKHWASAVSYNSNNNDAKLSMAWQTYIQ